MNKDTFWFKHDSNASQDPKMVMLTSVYGFEGYGRFWRIIEMIREQEGYRIDISSKHAFKMFASLLMFPSEEEAKNFIQDCVEEFNLLEMDEEYIWSPSLARRMETWDNKKAQAKKAIKARWDKKKTAKKETAVDTEEAEKSPPEKQETYGRNTDVIRTYNGRNTIREEKRREEKNREDISISLSLNAQAREENLEEAIQVEDSEEHPPKQPDPPPEEKVLWLRVAEEMTQYLTEEQAGKDQWEMMCYSAGGYVEPKVIAYAWAGWNQESAYVLENWKAKHVGKLTGWIKRHLQDEKKQAKVAKMDTSKERGKVSDYSKPRPKVRKFG